MDVLSENEAEKRLETEMALKKAVHYCTLFGFNISSKTRKFQTNLERDESKRSLKRLILKLPLAQESCSPLMMNSGINFY